MPRNAMRRASSDAMIRTGKIKEPGDECGWYFVAARCHRSSLFQHFLERLPILESVFTRQRVLHIPKNRIRGRFWKCAQQSFTGFGIFGAQGFEPAFGFLLQVVEGGLRRDSPGHAIPSFRIRLKSVEYRPGMKVRIVVQDCWVEARSLATDRRRPRALCC